MKSYNQIEQWKAYVEFVSKDAMLSIIHQTLILTVRKVSNKLEDMIVVESEADYPKVKEEDIPSFFRGEQYRLEDCGTVLIALGFDILDECDLQYENYSRNIDERWLNPTDDNITSIAQEIYDELSEARKQWNENYKQHQIEQTQRDLAALQARMKRLTGE